MPKVDLKKIVTAAVLVAFVAGCSPPVGSKKWCANMKEKDATDLTLQEMADVTKHCLM